MAFRRHDFSHYSLFSFFTDASSFTFIFPSFISRNFLRVYFGIHVCMDLLAVIIWTVRSLSNTLCWISLFFFLHLFFLGLSHAIFLTPYLLLLLFLKCLSTHYHTHPSLADRLKPVCW